MGTLTWFGFDTVVHESARRALVLFHKPSCRGCDALLEAWGRLERKYKESYSVAIADVDCAQQERLCNDYIMEDDALPELPTVRWFSPMLSKRAVAYEGPLTFVALDNFADATLRRRCEPTFLEGCDAEEKAYLQEE